MLRGNLRCYVVLKLYHLRMLILKSLALPKILMLSVVWVSAKPLITPHCLERLEFCLYMSASAQGFYLCTSVSSMPNHQPRDLISISWPDKWQVTAVYRWYTNFKSLQFVHILTWCFSEERKKMLTLMLVTQVWWTHFGFSSIAIILISHGRPTIHWCACTLRPLILKNCIISYITCVFIYPYAFIALYFIFPQHLGCN